MDKKCIKCGGTVLQGVLQARNSSSGRSDVPEAGMRVTHFYYVLPGAPVSANPITAFKQGLAGEPDDQQFPLVAHRCADCGFVELYARKE